MLTKKWDCVQVDNIVDPNSPLLTPQDSLNLVQLKSVLESINWTFKSRMRYECAVNSRVTVQGSYDLLENDKILICTPQSKSGSNRYIINTLTEEQLVLSGRAGNSNITLHFRPH